MEKPITIKDLEIKKEELSKVIFSAQSADNDNKKGDAYEQYINCLFIIANQLLELKLENFSDDVSNYVSSILHLLEHCCGRLRSISTSYKTTSDVKRSVSCIVPDVSKISSNIPRNRTTNDKLKNHKYNDSISSRKSFSFFPKHNIDRRNTVDNFNSQDKNIERYKKPVKFKTVHDIQYKLPNGMIDSLELPLDISHTIDDLEDDADDTIDEINQNEQLADNLNEVNNDVKEDKENKSSKEKQLKSKRISTQYIFSSDSEVEDDEDFYSDFSNIDYNEIGIDNPTSDNKKITSTSTIGDDNKKVSDSNNDINNAYNNNNTNQKPPFTPPVCPNDNINTKL